eukprot:TRINITY_DN4575_c0_g1_i1.p2 TRINITY_DN4575_c0_g1~~TRINITY_DN4575_c0_g1_i1.p2  ORF type:complete len:269 (+),score=62.47 TRINITY_DN4575_c0_g1_i1:95-901(+)
MAIAAGRGDIDLPRIAAICGAIGGAAGLAACAFRCCRRPQQPQQGARAGGARTMRAVSTPQMRLFEVSEIEAGGRTGFSLFVDKEWEVTNKKQHDVQERAVETTVYEFSTRPAAQREDVMDGEERDDQPVLLILEKLEDGQHLSVDSYAERAIEGTLDELKELGDAQRVTPGRHGEPIQSPYDFKEWELLLHSSPQLEDGEEDELPLPDDAEPETIRLWSAVTIHGGYAFAFQICGPEKTFEDGVQRARRLASTLQFTSKGPSTVRYG